MGMRAPISFQEHFATLTDPRCPQAPNTYEDPRCQETNSPYERIFSFFPQL